MKKIIKVGAVDQTLDIFVSNSSSTTGAGLTGLVFNTASLVCYYRKGATGTATALALVTQTVGGAHSDGGFVEIDATNMPGMYRLDLSDTIVAASGSVSMMLKGATNMAPLTIELQVVAYDSENATTLGLTNLTGLTPATVHSDLDDIQARLPAALTAGGNIKADALAWNGLATVALPATPTNITAATGIVLSGVTHTGAVIPTVSVLTGHTAQTGDSFARIGAAGAGLTAVPWNAAWDAEVQSEVVDALAVDTYPEPAQGAPAATATLAAKINYIYKFLRNKITTTSTQINIYDDAGTTVDQKSTISDDAVTFTRNEFLSGP